MLFLIVLAALVIWALAAGIVSVLRDGYGPVATRPGTEPELRHAR